MGKVNYTALNNANMKVNNALDTERVYDIEANVNVGYNGDMNGIEGGMIHKDGRTMATFNVWDGGNQSTVNFTQSDIDENSAVLSAITTFTADVKEYVKNNTIYN